MSSSINEREKAFENKFKADEEFRFKVNARAVRLFGLWAAKQLGLEGADADAYAEQVVDSDFDEPGNADFLGKVQKDFSSRGMDLTMHHLENEFNVHLALAKKEMMA
jgi:hypothetical protein